MTIEEIRTAQVKNLEEMVECLNNKVKILEQIIVLDEKMIEIYKGTEKKILEIVK